MSPRSGPARSSGILLAVTSLPSRFGNGDLGPAARAWIDSLAAARQTWWQILPVGPFGAGDSPYTAFSAFAGEDLLISLEDLVTDGLLAPEDLGAPDFPASAADFDAARPFHDRLLHRAWESFHRAPAPLRADFERFRSAESSWLDDWALYAAIKAARGGESWTSWPDDLRRRESRALDRARRDLAASCDEHRFRQFLWFRQWEALRTHARARGVRILGDLPIFVAMDSCDAWASSRAFLLDRDRRPTEVAGVPPDYFSKEGQLWGNPLYDWETLKLDGYDWWVRRARHAARLFDLTRIDHFRGFQEAWHVPAGAKSAKEGTWKAGPGAALFRALEKALGELPFLAEDLGVITSDVRALRREIGLPGMAVLQFAFDGDPANTFLPHNLQPDTVVYTGTHDNNTTLGWWRDLPDEERHPVRIYLRSDGRDISWELIRLAWSSVARVAIAPLQDVLILGSEGRMNTPGLAKGNWRWRVAPSHSVADRMQGLRGLSEYFNRVPSAAEPGPAKA